MQTADQLVQPVNQRRGSSWLTGEQGLLMPLLFLSPFLVLFAVFLLYPVANGLYISFTSWDLLTPKEWVGVDNYRALRDNYLFEKSLRNTIFFVLLSVPLSVCIPLLLAVLVDHPIFGRGIFRSIFATPLMMSVTTVSLLWVWFLNPTFGLVNHYFDKVGLPTHVWLNEDPWAMISIVATSVWWITGFNMILFLAGLQDIREDLYDAAKVDGAGAWSLFWNITIPGLRPTILFVLAITIIGSFRVFGQIYVMTMASGGPFDSTRSLVFHIYDTGFRNFRMGSASAIAWVLFIIVAVFTYIQFRLLRERD